MSTITQNKSTSSNSKTRSTSSSKPTSPVSSSSKSSSNSNSSSDKVSISKEASESGSAGGSVNLINGLKENYGADKAGDKNVEGVKGATDSKLSNEQKIDQLKSQLDSLKGLKGEELQSKLKELAKKDPELAEYLKKLLGEENKDAKKPEEAKKEEKPAEAAAAEKPKGADDGAPSDTFLWKPASESNGKLVILLPASIEASSVSISGPNVNETGSGSGRANGQRQHFRFGKSGKDMQGPVSVNITLANGGTKTITVANPAERMEGGDLKEGGQGQGQRQGMPGFGAFAGV